MVYDIRSRSLLFRAAGSSAIDDRLSTAVGQERRLRRDGERGFAEATEHLVHNLRLSLAHFETRVRERPDDYVVTRAPGYTGSGNLGWAALGITVWLRLGAYRRSKGFSPWMAR